MSTSPTFPIWLNTLIASMCLIVITGWTLSTMLLTSSIDKHVAAIERSLATPTAEAAR